MNQPFQSLDATFELVRAADPLRGSTTGAPDTEAALRIMLAGLPSGTVRKSHRRLRPVRLGVIGAGALAATLVVTNVESGGGGEVSRALDQTGALVSPARAAEIVAKVKRALGSYAPGEIVVTKSVEEIKVGRRTILSTSLSDWADTSPPYRERWAFSGTPGYRYGLSTTRQGVRQLYDPSRGIIYEPTAGPAYKLSPGPRAGTFTVRVPRAQVFTLNTSVPAADQGTQTLTISDAQARALRSGTAYVNYGDLISMSGKRVIGSKPRIAPANDSVGGGTPVRPADWVAGLTTRGTQVRLDGKAAIEIYDKSQSMTLWFSAKTLHPLREMARYPVMNAHGKKTGGWEVMTIRIPEYRILNGAAASTELLSLQHAHPRAKIIVSPSEYIYAQERLQAQ